MLTAPWEPLVVDGWRKDEGPGTPGCFHCPRLARHHLYVSVCVCARLPVHVCLCAERGQLGASVPDI